MVTACLSLYGLAIVFGVGQHYSAPSHTYFSVLEVLYYRVFPASRIIEWGGAQLYLIGDNARA